MSDISQNPPQDSPQIAAPETGEIQRRIFVLQAALAKLGPQVTDGDVADSSLAAAVEVLARLDPRTRQWWLSAFMTANAPADAREEMLASLGESVMASGEDSAGKKRGKYLGEYPLFAEQGGDLGRRNAALLEALKARGIETRKELIDALVAQNFNRDAVPAALAGLLKQKVLTNKHGGLNKLPMAIVKDIAGLEPPVAPVAPVAPEASEAAAPEADSADAKKKGKQLTEYPLFAEQGEGAGRRNAALLEALKAHGIETRKGLIDALVEQDFDADALQVSIGKLLKQTALAGKRGGLGKLALAIVKDLAGLEPPAAPDAPSRGDAPAKDTDSGTGKKGKSLTEYPLFAEQGEGAGRRNAALLEALNVHGIETRKQLIEALVALEFDVQVLQASIGNLLKQTMLAGKRGNFSKIVLAIIKDVAKLDLPKFLAALTQEGASGEDDVPPPAKPDSAPVPRNETELFAELKEKFPLVAEQMTQRGVTSLRQMWNASSEQMRGPWDTFLAEVKDLVVTGQPYRLEDARPKLGAAKLSMILTPGRPVKELWRDCAEATAAVARHQEPRMKFARLMMQYSPNLISAHLRSSPHAEGTSFTLTAPGEMRLAIEGNLLGLPRLERPAKAATYLKLFTGSQSPVDDKTLIPAAVEIMDMFKIPSVDVAKAFPKLELLYTDMVRHELPYLAQLMRLRQLYTLPDFVRASTRILRSDEEVGLRKKLQAPTSDLLRTEEGKNTTALLLASIFRVSAADIMAAKGFAPESVIKGAPTTPPPPPAQIQPGAATVG